MKQRHLKGMAALLIGMAMIYFGDRVLGVKLELFSGLSTYNLAWVMDMFFVPFMAGMVVAGIYGREAYHSGETFRFSQGLSIIIWVAYLPPLIVRSISYAEIQYVTGPPAGSSLMPFGLWALFVGATMFFSATGEIIGEVIIKAYNKANLTASKRKPSPSTNKDSKKL